MGAKKSFTSIVARRSRRSRRCRISARHWNRIAVQRLSPVGAFAFGLWGGLALFGCVSSKESTVQTMVILLIGTAFVAGALAISLDLRPSCRGSVRAVSRILVGALCCGLVTAPAIVRYQVQRTWPKDADNEGNVRLHALEGTLVLDSQTTGNGNRRLDLDLKSAEWTGPGFRIRAEWKKASFNAEILTGPREQARAGSTLRAVSLRLIPLQRGALLWTNMENISTIRSTGAIHALRGALAARISDTLHACAGKAGPLAQALLLGVKDELDGEYRSLFQSAGCAHLLALSGQHLAIICAFVSLLGKRISRNPKLVRRVSIGFAWVFVWIAGPGASLLRALFMLTLGEVARGVDRPQTGFSVLALSSALLALVAPSSINSLSSVFSFGAMAGLIGFSAAFSRILRPWLPRAIADALAASIAAVCATTPISILAFGTFVPAGVLSATAAAPVMLAFMWIALGGGIVALQFPWIAVVTRPALEFLESALISILEMGAWFPALTVGERTIARIEAVAVIATLVALIYAAVRKKSRAAQARLDRMRAQIRCADAKSRLTLLSARENVSS